MSTKEINPSLKKFQKHIKYSPMNKLEVPMIHQESLEKDFQEWDKKHNKVAIHMRNIAMYIQICPLGKENNLQENHKKGLKKY